MQKKRSEGEKRRLQFLADLIPEIIWTTDETGNIDYVNKRFSQYFNEVSFEAIPSEVLSKVHPEDRRLLIRHHLESIKSLNDLNVEVRLETTTGKYEWHLIKASRFTDEEGFDNKWFGSCTNIDFHVLALKKKDEFINIACHELKTPVTSLKASLQLLDRLKSQPDNKMLPQLIERAGKNATKIHLLIDDLLNVSQMSEGHLQLNKSVVDVYEFISDCTANINQDGYHITIKSKGRLEAQFDSARIEQVVVNFINNAIKYAPESKEIEIHLDIVDDQVKISVQDFGPGIPADKLDFLFQRYYRADNPGTNYTGLGLGLYICSEIIKRHEGKIGVESQIGIGSKFWFTLPLAK